MSKPTFWGVLSDLSPLGFVFAWGYGLFAVAAVRDHAYEPVEHRVEDDDEEEEAA